MPTDKERKISFGTLISRAYTTRDEQPFNLIEDVVKFNLKIRKKLNRHFDLKDQKFCFINSAKVEKDTDGLTIISGHFKSARHSFRSNLIDRNTGNERPSPKLISEGEIEKTHFAIKIGASEVFFALETNGNGVSINQIMGYITYNLKGYLKSVDRTKNFTIIYTKIGNDDFLSTLGNLKRTKIAEVYMNKALLGNSALNFSNRTVPVKRDVILTVKAEPDQSIKETAIDFFNSFSNNQNNISKIRIYGTDQNDTDVVLDTSFIEKVDHLTVSINVDTGEVNTTEMLTGLKGLLKTYK